MAARFIFSAHCVSFCDILKNENSGITSFSDHKNIANRERMEIFFTILIMTLVVSLSGVVTRVMPFQIPLPLMQIAIGALLAWPTFGLHVEFDPELF
ncbi:hypothetical protein NYV43_04820 [Escherichia coli]|nr:hypothetical protein [Escherichia coli]